MNRCIGLVEKQGFLNQLRPLYLERLYELAQDYHSVSVIDGGAAGRHVRIDQPLSKEVKSIRFCLAGMDSCLYGAWLALLWLLLGLFLCRRCMVADQGFIQRDDAV